MSSVLDQNFVSAADLLSEMVYDKKKKPTRRGNKKIHLSCDLLNLIDVCVNETELECFLDELDGIAPTFEVVSPQTLGYEWMFPEEFFPKKHKKTRRGKKKSKKVVPDCSSSESEPEPIQFGTISKNEAIIRQKIENVIRFTDERPVKKHDRSESAPPSMKSVRFPYGYYYFNDWFTPEVFQENGFVLQDGIVWYMYTFAGKRWCISNKLRNKLAHALNGNGTFGSDYNAERVSERNDEIARDIEQTVQSFERSNVIDVQAIKAQEEDIPADATFINANTRDLAYRRVQLFKLALSPDTVVHEVLMNIDPFKKYFDATLNHNSSMSAFRDVYFDLDIDVVVQALPAIGGIMHFVFDRFGGTGDTVDHLFAYPVQMVDLSSKDSLTFSIKMELPYRVMNTIRTTYASMGNGKLKMYLATPVVIPAGMAMPATITVFARASNVHVYNLKRRVSVVIESGLVALDSDTEQSMNHRGPASNVMRPSEIASQWGFLGTYPIPLEAGPDYEIAHIDVHPMIANTPLSQLCGAYSYYRGSLKFKITCNLSKFQNITLAALFLPQDAPYDNVYDAYAWQEIMFDEKHEAIVVVKFAHGSNWLPIYVDHYQTQRASVGALKIMVRSALVSTTPYNNAPTMLVQMCGGNDFGVAHPRDYGKRFQQPVLLESDVLNPEVPRTFATSTVNLYEDARIPNFHAHLTLTERPFMIPVTCAGSRLGVLGLLQNTHAAWSGSLDYIFVFEGHGQCEIRYDPTKRSENFRILRGAEHQAMAGYVKFGNSRSNPHIHVRVPFSSLYDYMPLRENGFQVDLNNSNSNGCLLVSGRGVVRVYRAAGFDFKVHFYNGVHKFLNPPDLTSVSRRTDQLLDGVDYPDRATAPYSGPQESTLRQANYTALPDPQAPRPNEPPPPPPRMESGTTEGFSPPTPVCEAGLFPDLSEVNIAARKASLLIDEIKAEAPDILVGAREGISEIREILPQIRTLLEKTHGAADSAKSVTDSICSLLSGPTTFAQALYDVARGSVDCLIGLVTSLHGTVVKVLSIVTPSYIAKFFSDSESEVWSDEAIALLYTIAIICGGMALGIDNPWTIAAVIACIGLAIPVISKVIDKWVKRLFGHFAASAVKAELPEMEAPASPIACGCALMTFVFGLFMPKNSGFDLEASASFGGKISRIFNGAKAIDEMIAQATELFLSLPFVEKLLGDQYKDVALLAMVDIEGYIAEVKELMTTDFYNLPLNNDKVRQQERLWSVHKKLDKHLPTMTASNYFLNTALRKVMDEQLKMYQHSLSHKSIGRDRIPPYISSFVGTTRVGKSTMVRELNSMVCDMMGWDKQDDVYTRNPSDDYFSGLANQKILFSDDLHTNITSEGSKSDMSMIMSFGSNAPWAPPMAAVSDKGRTVCAVMGNFCTNTRGLPTYVTIRNPDAYLARFHNVVWMRRREGVGEREYHSDYSHAEFIFLNPLDPLGKEELDEHRRVVRAGEGKVYNFQEFWQIYSKGFVQHILKERIARHRRQEAGVNMPHPNEEQLKVVQEICAHYEDVDYVDVEKVNRLFMEAEDLPPTRREIEVLIGRNPRYGAVIAGWSAQQLRNAIGDIYYVPTADTFVWRMRNPYNVTSYKELLLASEQNQVPEEEIPFYESEIEKEKITIQNLINAIWPVYAKGNTVHAEEMLDAVDDHIRDAVHRGIQRRVEMWKLADNLGKVGKRHFQGILTEAYGAVKPWWKQILAAICLGVNVFTTIRNVRAILKKDREIQARRAELEQVVDEAIDRRFPEAQYAKETSAAISLPVKKNVVLPEVQYAKETSAALGMPVQKKTVLPEVQYAKETSAALGMPVMKKTVLPEVQYAKETSAALGMPVLKKTVLPEVQYAKETAAAIPLPIKKNVILPEVQSEVVEKMLVNQELRVFNPCSDEEAGHVTVSYSSAPKCGIAQEIVVLESAAGIEQAQEMYRYNKYGKIVRGQIMLHFFFLDDRTILCNRHFFTIHGGVEDNDPISLYWNDQEGTIRYDFNLEMDGVFPVRDYDLCVVSLPQAIKGIRSNWSLIPTEAEVSCTYPMMGVLLSYSKRMDFTSSRLNSVIRRQAGKCENNYMNLDGSRGAVNATTIYLDGYGYPAVTGGGTCGALMILPFAGGKVFAIHSAAFREGDEAGYGIGTLVYKELLTQAMTHYKEPLFPQYESNYILPEPVFEAREVALNVILTLESGKAEIDVSPYGLRVVKIADKSTTGNMWTSYRPSPISRFFPNPTFRVPAITHTGDKRAPYEYDPRPDILGKYNKVIAPLPEDKIQRVVEHLSGEYQALQHPYRPSGLLCVEEAINGVPGAPFFDSINMHTSPGIPYSFEGHKKKGSLFIEVGNYSNGMPRRVIAVPKVEERFNAILSAAREGKQLDDVVFQEFMKDELLKRAKVFEKPATRGIANPPIDLLLAERAAFLPFIALLQYNRHKVDCQVGVNPMSGIEWTQLKKRLMANSDLVFDADYTAFDSTIHPRIIKAFAQIVNGTMGGTFEEQMARLTLASYSCDRVSQVTNVQVKIDQGMASGMPFTAVGNSVVNSIYLRVAWLMLAELHAPEFATLRAFDKHVKAAVYGDDNMVTVKAEVSEWYNLRTIALCLEPYGILMTDGQKNPRSETQPFSTWEKVRFLKRAFVLDPTTRLYQAPLDRKTILDRVRFTKAKVQWPDLEIRIEMSLLDAVAHGPEYFAALKFFINSCLSELQLPQFNISYTDEKLRWEAASLLVDMQGPGELTYPRERPDGQIEVYYARETDAPVRVNGVMHLRVYGPRQAVGEETRPLGQWKLQPSNDPPPPPPNRPQESLSLVELQGELNRRPIPVTQQQLRDELARVPPGTGMTLQQYREENRNRPTCVDRSTFDASQSAQTLEIERLMRQYLSGSPSSQGVTLRQLQVELDNRLPCLRIDQVRNELSAQTEQIVSQLRQTIVTPGLPTLIPNQPERGRRVFTAGRRNMTDSWNPESVLFGARYNGREGIIVVDGERIRTEYFEIIWDDERSMTVVTDQDELTEVREVSVSSGIAPLVSTWASDHTLWGGFWRRGRFNVKLPLAGGQETGNFQYGSSSQEMQVEERLRLHPGKWTLHTIAGRKFYQMHRGNHNDMVWPWVIVLWNCRQVLELLGARDAPKFACSHGKYEWAEMSEGPINIAYALFGRRRGAQTRQ